MRFKTVSRFALVTLVAVALFTPGVRAEFCLSNDVFGDEYVIGVTGKTTVTGATLISMSNRRYTFDERGVYGAVTSRFDGCQFSQEYHFSVGSISISCELPAGCIGSGPGQLTQSFDGATPVVNPLTCTIAACSPPPNVIEAAPGIDPEQP